MLQESFNKQYLLIDTDETFLLTAHQYVPIIKSPQFPNI